MLDVNATSIGLDHLVVSGHFGAGFSLFFAGSGLLAFGALVGRALLTAFRHRRMAAVAAASFQPDTPYAPGRIVLHGRVEMSEGAKRAVRVEVKQQGSEEENSGVWSHKWIETSRRVLVEPFYIVDAAGRRTRVEPRKDVLLVDAMDKKSGGKTQRVRSAELLPGEVVWASGELVKAPDPEGATGGYRGGPATLVLRAPAGQRMLLSSEPLAARFEEKARFHGRWTLYLGLVAMMVCGLCFGSYLVRLCAGETRTATITKLEEYTVETDNATTQHYHVHVTIPGEPIHLDDDVPEATFAKLEEGQSIPVRWVRARPRLSTLGPDATVSRALAITVFLAAWIPAALLYWYWIHRSLTWYESEVNEKGKGRLSESE